MGVIDRDLVRAINAGRCFAFVGSGPSIEMGVPDWTNLTKNAISELIPNGSVALVGKCNSIFSAGQYPKVFDLIEQHIGIQPILEYLDKVLVGNKATATTYKYMAKWPFCCYLTTNFDNYLEEFLNDEEISFALRKNSENDMRLLRDDASNIVFKVHGDTSTPDDIVLTLSQYKNFCTNEEHRVWREKISSILHSRDILIVGYSCSDPNFKDQLERAKLAVLPSHPIFMISDSFDLNAIRNLSKENIRIIPYKNPRGDHKELERLFRRYNPFIARRGSALIGDLHINFERAELAASLYMFTQLRLVDKNKSCIVKTYASAILKILIGLGVGAEMSRGAVSDILLKKTFAVSCMDPEKMDDAIACLHDAGLIVFGNSADLIRATQKGRDDILAVTEERKVVYERFEKSCRYFLNKEYSHLTDKAVDAVINSLNKGLLKAFEKRGLEIARSVFSDIEIDLPGATDILGVVNEASSFLPEGDPRIAFADLMLEIIARPCDAMKEYLAVLSQGYFAYHALGLEPTSSKLRSELSKQKAWILDASIILPMLAVGSINHGYAKDLMARIREVGLECYTTKKLLTEVCKHAQFAINNFSNIDPLSPQFLEGVLANSGFKQNLFLDGFAKWSLTAASPDFTYYLRGVLGDDYVNILDTSVKQKIEEMGIKVVNIDDWPGFVPENWGECTEYLEEIKKIRQKNGTYKNDDQCYAEAEVYCIHKISGAMFLSQSNVLNQINPGKNSMTWKPEGMYRYLSLFSSSPTSAELLYGCMFQDLYSAGLNIVDRNTIAQYVEPMVKQARMEMDREREKYEEALGKKHFDELREQFEEMPDEQKPFYSMRLAYYIAAQEAEKRKRAEANVAKAMVLKEFSEKEQLELHKLREEKKRKMKKNARKRLNASKKKKKRKKN